MNQKVKFQFYASCFFYFIFSFFLKRLLFLLLTIEEIEIKLI